MCVCGVFLFHKGSGCCMFDTADQRYKKETLSLKHIFCLSDRRMYGMMGVSLTPSVILHFGFMSGSTTCRCVLLNERAWCYGSQPTAVV